MGGLKRASWPRITCSGTIKDDMVFYYGTPSSQFIKKMVTRPRHTTNVNSRPPANWHEGGLKIDQRGNPFYHASEQLFKKVRIPGSKWKILLTSSEILLWVIHTNCTDFSSWKSHETVPLKNQVLVTWFSDHPSPSLLTVHVSLYS